MAECIFYLHGLGSSGKANTAIALRDYFAVTAPTYSPEDFEKSLPQLSAIIPPESTVVGTSMGGYFALKLAERIRLNVIAINPVITAREGLKRFEHSGFEDFVSNTFKPVGNLAAFEDLVPMNYQNTGSRVLLLAGSEDDVVPPSLVKGFADKYTLPFQFIDGMGHRVENYIGDVVGIIKQQLSA